MSVQMVNAARLRALVGFEDLIEPVSRAFQDFSAGLAQSSIVIMYPGSDPALGDAYASGARFDVLDIRLGVDDGQRLPLCIWTARRHGA